MRNPKPLQAVLVLAAVYFGFIILFDVVLDQVIPASLLAMYMFFTFAGVFMVFTFTDAGARELVAPIRSLVEDPSRRGLRNIVFVVLPLASGGSIHPAPPSRLKAYGKNFDIINMNNPFRRLEKENPGEFRKLVQEGAAVYIQNCHFCHGDKLDGKGPYAEALNPVPANFQDVGTIAQLQESYLFWRIASGGPGLPKEAAPWISSMPVWKDFLSEEEIWKVILFLYDYTGQRPRSFGGGDHD